VYAHAGTSDTHYSAVLWTATHGKLPLLPAAATKQLDATETVTAAAGAPTRYARVVVVCACDRHASQS
jgi:hypothetical protein